MDLGYRTSSGDDGSSVAGAANVLVLLCGVLEKLGTLETSNLKGTNVQSALGPLSDA